MEHVPPALHLGLLYALVVILQCRELLRQVVVHAIQELLILISLPVKFSA